MDDNNTNLYSKSGSKEFLSVVIHIVIIDCLKLHFWSSINLHGVYGRQIFKIRGLCKLVNSKYDTGMCTLLN